MTLDDFRVKCSSSGMDGLAQQMSCSRRTIPHSKWWHSGTDLLPHKAKVPKLLLGKVVCCWIGRCVQQQMGWHNRWAAGRTIPHSKQWHSSTDLLPHKAKVPKLLLGKVVCCWIGQCVQWQMGWRNRWAAGRTIPHSKQWHSGTDLLPHKAKVPKLLLGKVVCCWIGWCMQWQWHRWVGATDELLQKNDPSQQALLGISQFSQTSASFSNQQHFGRELMPHNTLVLSIAFRAVYHQLIVAWDCCCLCHCCCGLLY